MKFLDNWNRATVQRTRGLTPTIRLIELLPAGRAPAWTPGSHIRVRVAIDGRAETRCYSLIDDGSADGRFHIAVKLAENGFGGSHAMWALKPDDAIEIAEPDNHFELGFGAPSYTLLAGGVGITPLVSMARFLMRTARPVRLFHAVRNREEAAFADLLQSWLGDRFQLQVESESGRLDLAKILADIEPEGELYVCGPIGMLEAVRKAWEVAGRSMALLRYESFASSGHHAKLPFTVALPRFGCEIQVSAQQSLLSALEDAGIDVLADCRRGECGLCALDILSCDTPVDHRDVFLSDRQKTENRKICACVSRPVGGRIAIDTAYRGLVPAGPITNRQ